MHNENLQIELLVQKHLELYNKVLNSQRRIELSGFLKQDEKKVNSEEIIVISEALKKNNSLFSIDLSFNNINDDGMKYICEALKINSFLEEIKLNSNRIGQDGAKLLSEALKTNFSLKILRLNNNLLNTEGAKHFLDCLSLNSSLNLIEIENNGAANFILKEIAVLLKENKDNPNKARQRIQNSLSFKLELIQIIIPSIIIVK